MRAVAGGVLAVAVLIVGWSLFVPFEHNWMGSSYSCGMPVVTSMTDDGGQSTADALVAQCRSAAIGRMVGAWLVAAMLGVVAAGLFIAGRPKRTDPIPPPRFDGERWWWFDGSAWRAMDHTN
jgi:hypothetical protein